MASWDPARAKTQVRTTATRLRTHQQRLESMIKISRRDIAALLQRHDIGTARSKAEKLMADSRYVDLLATLETYCELLVERFEVFQVRSSEVDPPVLSAICGIIAATPRTDIKELHVLRDLICSRYPELRAAPVHSSLLDQLQAPEATPMQVDDTLAEIAQSHNIEWSSPRLPLDEKLRLLADMLNPASPSRTVDLTLLREICSTGLPMEPGWIRPRVWKLLLGTLPADKEKWESEKTKLRNLYYDLSHRFLDELVDKPAPTTALTPSDTALLSLSKDLSRLPPILKDLLDEDDVTPSPDCPFSSSAHADTKIINANAVVQRLELIKNRGKLKKDIPTPPPEIRLEVEEAQEPSTPAITVSSSDGPRPQRTSVSLSKSLLNPTIYRTHVPSVLRLLYIHITLNPAHLPTNLASLLAPLYVTMTEEVEPEEIPHIEADTFWLFAELLSEIGEIAGVEGGSIDKWLSIFEDRLREADEELLGDLNRKGLNPSLPCYSFAWLPNMLLFTIPLNSLLPIWDSIFTMPRRTSDVSPKVDYLLDICTSLLMRARAPLLRCGKPQFSSAGRPGLWGDEPTLSDTGTDPLGDAFMQGMKILQAYNVDAFGGSEKILEAALDLRKGREAEAHATQAASGMGLGGKLRDTVWRGITAKVQDPELSAEDDDGNATETPGFGSRLRLKVWKGITNQMDSPLPSPLPSPEPSRTPSPALVVDAASENLTSQPSLGAKLRISVWKGITNQEDSPLPSPSPPPTPSPPQEAENHVDSTKSSGFWGYARNIQESDAAASLSKASTNLLANWRARTSQPTKPPPSNDGAPPSSSASPASPSSSWLPVTAAHGLDLFAKRGSLGWPSRRGQPAKIVPEEPRRGSYPVEKRPSSSTISARAYSPPPRPTVFRPVRDSFALAKELASPLPNSPESVASPTSSEDGASVKSRSIQSTLATLTGSPIPIRPKSGPRPLLLNSASLITPSAAPAGLNHLRSSSRSPIPSRASIASPRDSLILTPGPTSGPFSRTRRTMQSVDMRDTSGFVPLKRGQVSTKAPRQHQQQESQSSVTSSSSRFSHSQQLSVDGESSGGDTRAVLRPASPGYIIQLGEDDTIQLDHRINRHSPPTQSLTKERQSVDEKTPESRTESEDFHAEAIQLQHKFPRPPMDSTDSDISQLPSLSKTPTRAKARRYPQRVNNIRIRTNGNGVADGGAKGSPLSATSSHADSAGYLPQRSPRKGNKRSSPAAFTTPVFSEEEGVRADDEEEPYAGLLDTLATYDDDDD